MEKGQSKTRSFLEANVNTLVGFILTLVFSPLFYSLVGMIYTYKQLGVVTGLFTLLSVARGYVIRRFFNKKEVEKDSLLVTQVNYYTKLSEEWYRKSEQWESLYRKSRTERAKQATEINDLLAFMLEMDIKKLTLEQYQSPLIQAYFTAINGLINQIRMREEEIELLKHNQQAVISDSLEKDGLTNPSY